MARWLAALVVLLASPGTPGASDWGGIFPGVTTTDQVRGRYGQPSRLSQPKVDGYDTQQWVYEGNRAPAGLIRMTVDFGILEPGGYRPAVVRLLKLEPKPAIFGRQTVMQGWGLPDAVGQEGDLTTFFYQDGLFVVFAKDEGPATVMIFSPPQPAKAPVGGSAAPPAPAPSRPAPAPPKQ